MASQYNDVFERIEKKYRLNAEQFAAIREIIANRLEPDAYPQTQVVSLYYDTPDNALICRSLEKPLYKEKLRLRAYRSVDSSSSTEKGAPDRVFLELKKKFKGVVYKRRVALSPQGAKAFLEGMSYETACLCFPLSDKAAQDQALSEHGQQVGREIAAFIRQRGLRGEDLEPAMFISCQREAWHDPESELRVTFDADLLSSRIAGDPFNFALPRHSTRLLGEGEAIMEIKEAGAYPLWLVQVLDELKIYPQSFSKYGTAYMNERNDHCA